MKNATLANGTLKDIEQVIIETAKKNPVAIAKFTPNYIDVAKGYRVRLKPAQCSVSTGGQGSLP